jgi:hypothetical protein
MNKMLLITRQMLILACLMLTALTLIAKPLPNRKQRFSTIGDPLDPCAANVLRSYTVKSPGTLCSNPNLQDIMFQIDGAGVTAGFYHLKAGSSPLFVEYKDGTMKMQLNVVLREDESKEYFIDLTGMDKSFDAPTGVGFTPALNYCAATNSIGWTFYNTFVMMVTGVNGNAGQFHSFLSPQNNKHTVQLGNGGNIWQPTLGSGLWFDNANTQGEASIVGDMQVELEPYQCCKKSCLPIEIAKNR